MKDIQSNPSKSYIFHEESRFLYRLFYKSDKKGGLGDRLNKIRHNRETFFIVKPTGGMLS